MKLTLAIALIAASNALRSLSTNATGRLESFQLDKFTGKWFEIGRTKLIRRTIEHDCQCVEAHYSVKPNEDIEVVNSCIKERGEKKTVYGNAHMVIHASELKVVFNSTSVLGTIGRFFQNTSNDANYVIKNVWTNNAGVYQHALVVVPHGSLVPFFEKRLQAIWLLSRYAAISLADEYEILEFAKEAGYDPVASEWKHTDQVHCRDL